MSTIQDSYDVMEARKAMEIKSALFAQLSKWMSHPGTLVKTIRCKEARIAENKRREVLESHQQPGPKRTFI